MASDSAKAILAAAADMRAATDKVVAQAATETTGQKVRRLQNEARALAQEHVAELLCNARALAKLAEDVAAGGDAYPNGIRDVARQWVEDLESRIQTAEAIRTRA